MTRRFDDRATWTGLGTLALLPVLVASNSTMTGLVLGAGLLAALLASAIAAAAIGDRLPAPLRGIAFAAVAASAAAATQLALRAYAPPALAGHDAVLVLLAANGAFGWLAASRGEAGASVASLRAALALGFGGAFALVALGGLRSLVGGLLVAPIGGFVLLALALAAWQAWRQQRPGSPVPEP
jgi:Na+-translocating ferredoxin:NAD+ oxidoreductase RnfE subunit